MTRRHIALLLISAVLCGPAAAQDKQPDPKADKKKAGKDEADKGKKDDEQKKLEEQQALQAALKELLLQPCSLGAGNKVKLSYPCSEIQELEDWKSRGFDKVDVCPAGSSSEVAMELGAGSRKLGTAFNKLPLRGDFTISIQLFIPVNSPSAILCFLLGKKVGVNWGQQIVKARSLRPYNRRSRLNKKVYREERKVALKFSREGAELTIKCNGVVSDKRNVKKGELDGIQVGVMARNIRFAITDLQIEGVVDAQAVLKAVKKKKKKKT